MRASLAPARFSNHFDRPSTFPYHHNPGATPISAIFALMARHLVKLRTCSAQKGGAAFHTFLMPEMCQQAFWVVHGCKNGNA